jgi:hypothetical protein
LIFNINKYLNKKIINDIYLKDYLTKENLNLYSKYFIKLINLGFVKKIKEKCDFNKNNANICYQYTTKFKNSSLFFYLTPANKEKLINLKKESLYFMKIMNSLKKFENEVNDFYEKKYLSSKISLDDYENGFNKLKEKFNTYPSSYDYVENYKEKKDSIKTKLEHIEYDIKNRKEKEKEQFKNKLFLIDSIIGGIIAIFIAWKMGCDLSATETVIETKSDKRYKKGYRIVGEYQTPPLWLTIFIITSIVLYFLQIMLFN